jgi:hypothetical protein
MKRADKGPVAPPPVLDGTLGAVSQALVAWPDVVATVHWDLDDTTRVDGVDFYVGERELGHVHLDGSLHLATNPTLGAALVADGLARRFPYAKGWVCENVDRIGAEAAIALFRRNYDRLSADVENLRLS